MYHAIVGGWGWGALLAWLYLLLPGSLGAPVIYFLLVREWGASRAGTHAFGSPVIAVAIGTIWFSESVLPADLSGMLLLGAAGIVLRGRR